MWAAWAAVVTAAVKETVVGAEGALTLVLGRADTATVGDELRNV
jgi:hypothetical protein